MITARFTALCPGCDRVITEGDPIDLDEESGHWMHPACLPAPDPEPRHREVCPRCHTVRTVTGACLCEEEK